MDVLTFFSHIPLAPFLQVVVPKTVKILIHVTYPYSTHPVARNEVEGGSTGKDVKPPTHLIEPQGKIKNCALFYRAQFLSIVHTR